LVHFDDYSHPNIFAMNSWDEIIIETVAPYDKPNLTWPIKINWISPWDSVMITVKDIKLSNKWVMFFGHNKKEPRSWILRNDTEGSIEKEVEVINNVVKFNDDISFTANPMVWRIQIIWENNKENIGLYWWNMDTKELWIWSTLLLYDEFWYGKFILWDVHASMWDWEICWTGVEIPASVYIKIEVVKNTQKHNPIIINQDKIILLATSLIHEDAYITCIKDAVKFLQKQHWMSFEEINCLVSAVCDLWISTIVSKFYTYKISIPSKILPNRKNIIQNRPLK